MSDWEHSLFSCFDNPKVCCFTWCCGLCSAIMQELAANDEPPILDILGLICCCQFCCLIKLRGDIRKKYGIEGSCLSDCFTIWCCGPCALCQQAQQVRLFEE